MPPRIGVNLAIRDDRPRSEVVELVQWMEGLGYDSVWTGESWGRELFTVLTHLACNTSRIKLGAGIANVYSRTPSLLAQSAATLDEVSGGRLLMGLGSSGEKVVRDWHGVPFEKPLQRTREYIDILNLALSGHRVNYDGEFYRLRDFRLGFNPPREHVPIFIASIGPKNVQLTGELADGWAPIYLSPKRLPHFLGQMEIGAKKAGRSVQEIDIRPYVVACVCEDLSTAQALARGHLAFYIGGMGHYYHDLVASYGYVEEAARVKELWGQRDRAGAAGAITDAMLKELALLGNAEQCRQQLMDLAPAGMDSPVIYVPNGSPQDIWAATIQGLAPSAFR